MAEHLPLDLPQNPRLSQNITHFARALRRAGLPIGPGRVIEAVRAVEAVGFTRKHDFFWTLQACFINRPEQARVFAQVFRLYWRDPQYLEHMMAMMLPAIRGVHKEKAAGAAEKRAAEALLDGAQGDAPDFSDSAEQETLIEVDASATSSGEERLRNLDFEQMSVEEMAQAKRMLARLSLPVRPLPSRRGEPSHTGGRFDARRSLRQALRKGGELDRIALKKPRPRWPNLVVICDISGSMSQYSRMVLHFVHAVANRRGQGWARVYGFTFGTQLTNITRHLATRDVDAALADVGRQAQDWEGGTRIGACLHDFNRDWSRRVMGQGAVALLITDGLDRDEPGLLAREMERLHLSSHRLIWINPLLRWHEFAPKARGIAAMLPHVDAFRAGHSIATLEELGKVVSSQKDTGEKARLMAQLSG